jgi:hypothetical protein
MAKNTKPAPAPPQKVWRIQDFFVAAAVRKGVTDLAERLGAEDTERQVTQDEKEYRIDWSFGPRSKAKWGSKEAKARGNPPSFTIHCDGSWIYANGTKVIHGKLQPPHAKGWVDKMITKGTPGEYARSDWQYYFNLRNLK